MDDKNRSQAALRPIDVDLVWRQTALDYTRFAEEPDSFSIHIERPVLLSLLERIPAGRALDLGCGSGQYTLDLARRGPTTGIDQSPDMLAIARQRADEAGVTVDFRQADVRSPLPFADASLDLVFMGTVLHYVEDLAAVFSEIRRVLAPGGSLLISTLHPTSTALFPTAEEYALNPTSRNMRYFELARRAYFPPWAQRRRSEEGAPGPLECHHHLLEDYFGALGSAGLQVKALREPRARDELLRLNPGRFTYTRNYPIYLVLLAERA